jgi:hypothetical protein
MPNPPSGRSEFVLLQLALPGLPVRNVGVLLLETATRRLYWLLRTDWDLLAPPEDARILAQLDQEFQLRAQEMDGEQFLLTLENQLSNTLRLTPRMPVESPQAFTALNTLFGLHCMT